MIYVCFYKGYSLAALAVRLDTQRPKQAFRDVPAHCALVVGETLYEVVSLGWKARPALPSDLVWGMEMPGLGEDKAKAAAELWRGAKYGWWVDLLIALSRFIPSRWLSTTRGAQKYICSAFVKAVLEAAGWNCPHWLAEQYVPESPNDLWFALRPK